MKYRLICYGCKKDLGILEPKACMMTYKGYIETGKRKMFCCEECYDMYMNKFFVEEYKGNKIYKLTRDGITGYVPYIGCQYYYLTLEECKARIDDARSGFYNIYLLNKASRGNL